MEKEKIREVRELLEKAQIFSIIPGTVIMKAEDYNKALALLAEPAKLDFTNRDLIGAIVRQAWINWAEKQPNPKKSWLKPYSDLCETDKEADRQIGEAVLTAFYPTFAFDQQNNQVPAEPESHEHAADEQIDYMHKTLKEDAVRYDLPTEEIIHQLAFDNEKLEKKLQAESKRKDEAEKLIISLYEKLKILQEELGRLEKLWRDYEVDLQDERIEGE